MPGFIFRESLFIDSSHYAAVATVVAKLAEVDTLPGAEGEAPIGDGDGEANAEEGTFGVGGHVIGSLHGVIIEGLALPHKAVHDLAEVGAHVGVSILIDG